MQVSKLYSNFLPNFLLNFIIVGWTLNFHACAANISNDTGIFPGQSGVSARAPSWTGAVSETFQGRTYTLVYQPTLSWENAWLACQSEGLTLARIETVEELQFLLELAGTSDGNGHAWVGATSRNRTEDQYIWVETGEIVPSFIWAQGQPDRHNFSGVLEDCVELRAGYEGANDAMESGLMTFICTDPLVSPTTTTTTTEFQDTSELTTKSSESTPNPNPNPGFCTSAGLFPDPNDCQKYHACVLNEVGDLGDWMNTCPRDLVWCQSSEKCETNDVCPCSLSI